MSERRMTYDESMAWGADQYRDVLEALADAGLRAEFIQAGGMCAAIEIVLDAGHYVLLTDRDDSLSWERHRHVGWYCGLYEPEVRQTVDGPLRWLLSEDGSTQTAVQMVRRVLRGETEDEP